jgi:hypothetical protein
VTFKNRKFIRFPKVKIYIDHTLVDTVHFKKETESISIPIELEEGKHVLEIEHFGKTSQDTNFANGTLVADTEFTIESITIDDFKFFYYLLCLCEFRADWKGMEKPQGFPDLIRQSRTVGPNGKWRLAFETPIDNWLIQRRINETTQNHNLPTK